MRNLLLLYFATLFVTTNFSGITTIYSLFLKASSYTVDQIGFLFSLFALMNLAARLPAGLFYSPARAKMLLSSSLVLMAISSAGYAFGKGPLVLVALTSLHGIAFGSITTILLALCIDLRPPNYSGAVMMGWFTAFMSVGFGIGGFFSGFIAHSFGFAQTFWSSALFPFLALGLLASLKLDKQQAKPIMGSGKGEVPLSKALKNGAINLLHGLRHLDDRIIVATILSFYINFLVDTMDTFFPLYALDVGLTLAAIGVLKSVRSFFAAGIRPLAGFLFQWVDIDTVNNVSLLVTVLVIALVPSFTSMGMFLLLLPLIGLARGLTRVSTAVMVVEASSGSNSSQGTGIASSIYNMGLDLGSVCGPIVGGMVASALGIPTMFRLLPSLLLLTYFLILIGKRRFDS